MFHLTHAQPEKLTKLQAATTDLLVTTGEYSSLMMFLMSVRCGFAKLVIDGRDLSKSEALGFVEAHAHLGYKSLGNIVKLTHPLIAHTPEMVRSFALETASSLIEWAAFAWNVVDGEYDDDRLLRSIATGKNELSDGSTTWTIPPLSVWRVPSVEAMADWRATEFKIRGRLALLSYHDEILFKEKGFAEPLDLFEEL